MDSQLGEDFEHIASLEAIFSVIASITSTMKLDKIAQAFNGKYWHNYFENA